MSNALVVDRPHTTDLDLEAIAGSEITSPPAYAARIRELQGRVHMLSPMAAVARIAPSHVINPMVVVIDPSVDAESGRGAEVYFQASIHKKAEVGERKRGERATYQPLEVSLNKNGLLKILSAAGVNVYPTERLDGGTERNLWIMRTQGDVLDFDGRYRRLPPGTASVDLRDGSADIGEWTPEEWAVRVADANKRKAVTPKDDQWKVKPEPINGWTHERVIGARRFGLRLAETKSLNALARNLGVRQVYTIAELQKPFVIFRASYVPDLTNPRVAEMMAAANLGARQTLYPGMSHEVPVDHAASVTHGAGDPTAMVDGEVVTTTEAPERMQTAAAPTDAEELRLDEPTAQERAPGLLITKVLRRGKDADIQYFVETKEGITLFTTDHSVAKACAVAAKDGQPRDITTERVMVQGQPYRQILEVCALA